MKLKYLLTVSALMTLGLASAAQAANSINNNGTLLVTLDTAAEELVFLTTLTDEHCTSGNTVEVATFTQQGSINEDIVQFCDVTHARVAGLSGTNEVVIGGLNNNGFDIPGTLDIRGGSNNDVVTFGGDINVGRLIITLRGGNNRVRGAANSYSPKVLGGNWISMTSGSVSVNTTLDIDTNNGNDIVNFRALTVGGTADINVGGGDDKANIFGGAGTNSFNKVFLRLGNGDNEGSIRNTVCHLCQVFGGGGKDDIFLGRVTAGIDVDVIAGGGDDYVELNRVTSGTDVNANGGAGNDCLIDNDGSATTVSNFEACTQ